jgi:hypothetical protein
VTPHLLLFNKRKVFKQSALFGLEVCAEDAYINAKIGTASAIMLELADKYRLKRLKIVYLQ